MIAASARLFDGLLFRPVDPVQSRARIAWVARLLDGAFTIPGTPIRFGIDPLIGLIPGGGDTIATALSGYIVYEAYRAGLPREALLRMIVNIVIDLIVGLVPVLGDVADVFWRANQRNLAIFDEHLARRTR